MPDFRQLLIERAIRRKNKKRPPKRLRKLLYPSRIESAYKQSLDTMLTWLRDRVEARIVPMLPELYRTYGRERTDAADLGTLSDEMRRINFEWEQAYSPEELRRLAQYTGRSVNEWNEKQMNRQLIGITEVDIFGSEPWLARELGAFIVDNVNLIQSIETEYLSQVEKLVATSVRSGVRVEQLRDEIYSRYDVSKSRASLIARDQVGKFNGQLVESRQKQIGVDEYIWRTSGDARVRDTHAVLNGQKFKWSNPPAVGHPGQDFQCRCTAEPVLDKLFSDE